MGYTHYWNHNGFNKEDWAIAQDGARRIIEASEVPVQFEYDDDALPDISDDVIRFNGIDDDGHETFYMPRTDISFAFCKTARKPYDEIVVAILGMLADINSVFEWSSDGSSQDHADGKALYNEAIGNECKCALKRRAYGKELLTKNSR